jgi:hypothetical protein
MAEIIEPGAARDRVEIADLYKAYAQTCRLEEKRAVSAEEFSRAVQRLCEELDIKVTRKGEHVCLMKVRLREMDSVAL